MTEKHPKRPRDPNQLAKLVVDLATGARQDKVPTIGREGKNPSAVELGRLGGLKGGRARAAALSDEQRSEIARNAARKRWTPKSENDD